MSELSERLWYASERVSPSDITMEAPPRGSLKWVEIQCAEAARLIDAIDHVHVVTTSTNWAVTTERCLFDGEVWPCWHHRQIHPDDPVVQQYVENVRQEMDERS